MAEPMGFYTDTRSVSAARRAKSPAKNGINCRAPTAARIRLSGDSYDNTRKLDGIHWRHVKFIEQFTEDRKDGRWLLMSDVCKHCVQRRLASRFVRPARSCAPSLTRW